jgi:hypothetical protein
VRSSHVGENVIERTGDVGLAGVVHFWHVDLKRPCRQYCMSDEEDGTECDRRRWLRFRPTVGAAVALEPALREAGCVTVGRVGVEMEWWAVGESAVGERVRDPKGTLVDCTGGVV